MSEESKRKMSEETLTKLANLQKLIYKNIAKTTRSTPPTRPKPLSEQRISYARRGG